MRFSVWVFLRKPFENCYWEKIGTFLLKLIIFFNCDCELTLTVSLNSSFYNLITQKVTFFNYDCELTVTVSLNSSFYNLITQKVGDRHKHSAWILQWRQKEKYGGL